MVTSVKVVGYIRLSRDEDRENYSSIISQQAMIEDYAYQRGWELDKIYIDDNCSGYTFDRVAFTEMMKKIAENQIDIILTKDLSRIGRNNGRVLMIIDQLREWNKSLILMNEGKEGLNLLTDEYDILGIKTWYNEMYVKDISRKIRSSMGLKQKKGELLMGNFFGYKKIKDNDKYKLVVDERIRPVIELIFKLYIQRVGNQNICRMLERQGYPTPSEYLRCCHEEKGRIFKNLVESTWQPYMIQRIIQNDIYIGTLRTKKRQSRLIKGKQENIPRDEQYVFLNNHEAIISGNIFNFAREIKLKRTEKTPSSNKTNYYYLFSGLIICGDCGHKATGLNLRKLPAVQRGYNCGVYQKYGNYKCMNHSIKEDKVIFFYTELIYEIQLKYKNQLAMIQPQNKENKIVELNNALEIANNELKLIMGRKFKELATENNNLLKEVIEKVYSELENERKQKILKITKKIRRLAALSEIECGKDSYGNVDLLGKENLNRVILEAMLKEIKVFSDRTLEFQLEVNIDELCKDIDENSTVGMPQP